jgi:hypothetical protein
MSTANPNRGRSAKEQRDRQAFADLLVRQANGVRLARLTVLDTCKDYWGEPEENRKGFLKWLRREFGKEAAAAVRKMVFEAEGISVAIGPEL